MATAEFSSFVCAEAIETLVATMNGRSPGVFKTDHNHFAFNAWKTYTFAVIALESIINVSRRTLGMPDDARNAVGVLRSVLRSQIGRMLCRFLRKFGSFPEVGEDYASLCRKYPSTRDLSDLASET